MQTLAFVARRLVAESVALVFAVRGAGEVPELTGLSELRVEGLPDANAGSCWTRRFADRSTTACASGSFAEARGNPLALLEPPRG